MENVPKSSKLTKPHLVYERALVLRKNQSAASHKIVSNMKYMKMSKRPVEHEVL